MFSKYAEPIKTPLNTEAPMTETAEDTHGPHSVWEESTGCQEANESKIRKLMSPKPIIDRILIARCAEWNDNQVEFLTLFRGQTTFAEWVSEQEMSNYGNAKSSREKFNATDKEFPMYFTSDCPFDGGDDCPVRIVSLRPSDDLGFEYLYEYRLETGIGFVWDRAIGELVSAYEDTKVYVEKNIPATLDHVEIAEDFELKDGSSLQPHEVTGVNWMLERLANGHGFIVADETGIDKRLQVIAMMMALSSELNCCGPFIVIAKEENIDEWATRIKNYSEFSFIDYTGTPSNRKIMRDCLMNYTDENGVEDQNAFAFNILLTTHAILVSDVELFSNVHWVLMIVDDGAGLRFTDTERYKACRNVNALQRVILTDRFCFDTMKEFWNLVKFVSPNATLGAESPALEDISDTDTFCQIRELVLPYVLRRTMQDVYPEKSVRDLALYVGISDVQKDLLRLSSMGQLFCFLARTLKSEACLSEAICHHPFLIDEVGAWMVRNGYDFVEVSGKLVFLDYLLKLLRSSNEKVIVWSRRKKMIGLLSKYCVLRKHPHFVMTADMSDEDKQKGLVEFRESNGCVFLISTKLPSSWRNLFLAKYNVVFDSNLDDLQITTHRQSPLTQTDVIRLVTFGTAEHAKFASTQRKWRLWQCLLDACDGEITIEDVFKCSPPPPPASVFRDGMTFDEFISTYACVQNTSNMLFCRDVPQIDLTRGISDEDFLKKLDKAVRLPKDANFVCIDKKLSKRLLKLLKFHGYGAWEAIRNDVDNIVPLEQLIKFCHGALILHFRSVKASKISRFPLLIWQVQNYIPDLDLGTLCRGDVRTSFSRVKNNIYVKYAAGCRDLFKHIVRTAFDYLSTLEDKLLISEWKRTMLSKGFNFDELLPLPDTDQAEDEKIYNELVNGDVNAITEANPERVRDILQAMRAQIIRSGASVNRVELNFWTKPEVMAVVDSLRNFGSNMVTLPIHYLHSRTGLLSKNADIVKELADWLYERVCDQVLAKVDDKIDDWIVPATVEHLVNAPPQARTILVIPAEVVLDMARCITALSGINNVLIAMKNEKNVDMTTVMEDGCGWFTYHHLVSLLTLLLRYGYKKKWNILSAKSFEFAAHMSQSDRLFLASANEKYRQPGSMIPPFLLNYVQFIGILAPLRRSGFDMRTSDRWLMFPSIMVEKPSEPKNSMKSDTTVTCREADGVTFLRPLNKVVLSEKRGKRSMSLQVISLKELAVIKLRLQSEPKADPPVLERFPQYKPSKR